MKFKSDFFKRYITVAPVPLAVERAWECEIQSQQEFQKPLLDIGCGEGIFAWGLMAENIDVGVEPNSRELDRAREINLYDELIECYGNDIPKPDQSFRTIISNSVLEHIPDIEPVLREAHRLLMPDGVVYLTLPTDKFDRYSLGSQVLSALKLGDLANKYRAVFNRFWAHYHFYDRAGWEAMFERCGFKVRDSFEYGSRVQCTLNSMMSPFCLFAFVVKKFTNRWFLFPSLRVWVADTFYVPIFGSIARLSQQEKGNGGLIFFALEKK